MPVRAKTKKVIENSPFYKFALRSFVNIDPVPFFQFELL